MLKYFEFILINRYVCEFEMGNFNKTRINKKN